MACREELLFLNVKVSVEVVVIVCFGTLFVSLCIAWGECFGARSSTVGVQLVCIVCTRVCVCVCVLVRSLGSPCFLIYEDFVSILPEIT